MGNVLQALNQGIDASNKITDTSRKAAAYNALKSAYGDIAGSPEQALELQSYGARQDAIPVEQQQRQFNLDNAKTNAPLIQRQEAAKAGQEEEAAAKSTQGRQGQAIYNAAQFVQSAIDRGQDPLAAFDKVGPLMGLPPDKQAAVRSSIEANPGAVKDFIKAYGPKPTASSDRFQVVQSPDGTLHRVTSTGADVLNDAQGNPIKAYQAPQAADRIAQGGQRLNQQLQLAQPDFKGQQAEATTLGKEKGKTEAQDLPMSAAEVRKQQQSFEADTQSFDVADKAIDKALKDTGYGSAGLASHIPGNPWAANLAADLDTVQSKVVLDTISELKGLSKTGSTGFGQLSDREGDLIKARLGSVKQATTPAQLRESLIDLRHQLEISRERLRNAHTADLTARAPQPKSNKPGSSDTSGGRVEGGNVILKWNPAKGMVE